MILNGSHHLKSLLSSQAKYKGQVDWYLDGCYQTKLDHIFVYTGKFDKPQNLYSISGDFSQIIEHVTCHKALSPLYHEIQLTIVMYTYLKCDLLWNINWIVTFGILRNTNYKHWNHCSFLMLDCSHARYTTYLEQSFS